MTHQRIARSSLTAATVLLVLAMARSALTQAWTPVASMPTRRAGFVAAVFDGRIYAIGGIDDTESGKVTLTAVEIYDPATDTWTVGTAMPTARGGATYCVLDGRIYVIGGKLGYWEDATTAVEAYDPATDTWTVLSPMPTARYGPAVVVRDGKIAAIGGCKGVGDGESPYTPVRAVEVYDPQTDTWDERAPYPPLGEREIAHMLVASYAQEGPIPVISWNPIRGKIGRALAYDLDTNTWTDRAAMPVEREAFGMCGVAGRIFVISGRDYYLSGRLFPDVLAYNPVTDTWIACPPLPAGIKNPSAAALGGRIYVLGGRTAEQGGLLRTTVEVYEPDPDQLSVLDQVALLRRNAVPTTDTVVHTYPDQPTTLEVGIALDPPADLEGFDPSLTLDLSPVGGPAEVPLTSPDGRRFQVSTTITPAGNGRYDLELVMRHGYAWDVVNPVYPLLTIGLQVWPAGDEVIYADGCAPGWEGIGQGLDDLVLDQTEVVCSGTAACAVQAERSFAGWSVEFEADPQPHAFGYTTLRFAFHPGDAALADGDRFTMYFASGSYVSPVAEGLIDMDRREWQLVEIPLEPLELDGPVLIKWTGNFAGTFYLDDVALVAAEAPVPTAVLDSETALPTRAALEQNYPNPFNPVTAIAYELAEPGLVSLAIYNTLGQRVRALMHQRQLPGAYTVQWDGRNDAGAALASGVYLYRLVVDGRPQQTRRMLLLR